MEIQISNILSILALFASFFSIWLHNQGFRKQLLVANMSNYTRRYQEIVESLPADVLHKEFNLESLDEVEQYKILRSMWFYFDLCYEEYILYYELNLIDKKLWRIWENNMKSAFSRPVFYQGWKKILERSSYSEKSYEKFYNFVDEQMSLLHNKSKN